MDTIVIVAMIVGAILITFGLWGSVCWDKYSDLFSKH